MSTLVRVFIPETEGTHEQILQVAVPTGAAPPDDFARMGESLDRMSFGQRILDAVVSMMASAANQETCMELTIGICCPSSHGEVETTESHGGAS